MVESLKVEIALEGSEEVQSQMRDLGETVRNTFVGMASAAAKFSTAFAAVGVVIGVQAAKQLLSFANAAEETEKALTQLQKVSGQSFQNLSTLANVFAQGGTNLNKFASELGNLSEKIASAGEAAAKLQAIRSQAEDVAKGLKATALPAITLKERVDELLASLSRVPPEQQWFKLADIFKQLGDNMERARIGNALGLSPETIATLSLGSEKLRQLQADAVRLGLTLTTSNQQALQQMGEGWNQFTTLLSAFFQKIGAAAAPAFTQILASFQPVMQQIVADFQNMPLEQAISNLGTRLAPAFTALGEVLTPIVTALGTAAGTAFADAVLSAIKSGLTPTESLWDAILNDFAKFGESIVANAIILGKKIKQALGRAGGGGAPATGGDAPGMAGGGLLGGRGTGTSDSNLAWLSRGEYIMPARVVAQPGVASFLEALRRSGRIPGYADGGAVGGVHPGGPVTEAIDQLKNAFKQINSIMAQLSQNINGIMRNLMDSFNTADAGMASVQDTIQGVLKKLNDYLGIGGRARGGLLGGRGTGTSDSNLAWVSRGEHIMPARAVSQPGVLAFLEMLRMSGGNLGRVLDGMGRFALGGLVRGPIPAFAAGGLAGGSNVTIQFPGLPAIGGLRASSSVVDQLQKAAALAQVRSGGRKPSRYS